MHASFKPRHNGFGCTLPYDNFLFRQIKLIQSVSIHSTHQKLINDYNLCAKNVCLFISGKRIFFKVLKSNLLKNMLKATPYKQFF